MTDLPNIPNGATILAMGAPTGGLSKWLAAFSLPLVLAAQIPPQRQVQEVTVDVSSSPVPVNTQVVFSATITPPPTMPLLYRFYVDGQVVCGDWQSSSQCRYGPREVGTHYVNVEVGQAMRPQRGGRGSPQSGISVVKTSIRHPFEVQQVPPPSEPRPVLLSLKLISLRVVTGEAASFVVSAEGTRTLPSFVFNAGDGSTPQSLDVAEFTHIYQEAGPISASVILPPSIAGRGASVSFEVAPTPTAPIALVLKLTSPTVVVGEPASFAVSVEGTGDIPQYVLDPGDGTTPQARRDASFTYVYPDARHITASVSLPAGIVGTGSSVAFDVTPPPQPPIELTLQLTSSKVVAGESAAFVVSVPGGGALPEYVLNAGDGSAPETRRDGAFTHVYPRSGRFYASVSMPPGAPGIGSSVIVNVSDTVPLWLYVVLGLAAVLGAYVIGRGRRPPVQPPVVAATLHPHPSLRPSFDPAKPRGVSLEVRFVPNFARMRFTSRVLIGPEKQ